MSKADHDAVKVRLDSEFKADKLKCDALSGNGKDVCMAQAKGKDKVARAELKAEHSAKPGDRDKLAEVRGDTAYDLAKERCDDLAGNAKDVCVQEAKAVHTRAKADAKLARQTGEARMKASDDKRDADYKVMVEKCDALAGDAKSACVAKAKASQGKT